MKALTRLNGLLLGLERALLVLLFSLTILLAFSQVILRNFFSVGIVWADPLLRNAVLWIGFFGASLATQQEKHIRIDIVGRFLTPRKRDILRVATNTFALAVCVLLALASLTFVANEIDFHDTLLTIGDFPVPSWWVQVVLPAGFAVISFRLALQILGLVMDLVRGGGRSDDSGRSAA